MKSLRLNEREKMDEVIKPFTKELNDKLISEPFPYINTKGQAFIKNFGQVSTLLYQRGIDIGVKDLVVNIPNVK